MVDFDRNESKLSAMKMMTWTRVLLGCVVLTGCGGSHVHPVAASAGANQSPASSLPDTAEVVAEGQFIAVGGEIRGPGQIAYRPDLTVIGAINTCGGFTEKANRRTVRLIHNQKVILVDCIKAISNPGQDPDVSPGDKISVPSIDH